MFGKYLHKITTLEPRQTIDKTTGRSIFNLLWNLIKHVYIYGADLVQNLMLQIRLFAQFLKFWNLKPRKHDFHHFARTFLDNSAAAAIQNIL